MSEEEPLAKEEQYVAAETKQGSIQSKGKISKRLAAGESKGDDERILTWSVQKGTAPKKSRRSRYTVEREDEDPARLEKLQDRQSRKSELSEEAKRIAALAKTRIQEWIEQKVIKEPPVEMNEDVYLPKPANEGFHFCIYCSKQGKYRLPQHIRAAHPEIDAESDQFKIIEQVSRGVTENMKRAYIDVHELPNPTTKREYEMYSRIVTLLKSRGVPVYGRYDEPQFESGHESEQVLEAIHDVRDELSQSLKQYRPVERQITEVTYRAGLPDTLKLGHIPRHLLYYFPGDRLYRAEKGVHPVFKYTPPTDLIYKHEYDDMASGYWDQRFHVKADSPGVHAWMVYVDKHLKYYRRVLPSKIPWMDSYRRYIKNVINVPVENDEAIMREPSASEGRSLYESYVCRFLLCAMRARGRLGEDVSMDDALYSGSILLEFFAILTAHHVPPSTRRGFAKALASMYSFISLYMDENVRATRTKTIRTAQDRLRHLLCRMTEQQRREESYRGITAPSKKEAVPYCVARAVVSHEKVINKLNSIYGDYAATGFIAQREYNYFIGALMAYIVQCGCLRNESIYKMRYGSVFPIAGSEDKTGLRRVVITTRRGAQVMWVGPYPLPKSRDKVREETTFRGGCFVLDSVSRELILKYRQLREHVATVIRDLDVKTIESPTHRYFLLYSGEPVRRHNVPELMKRFLHYSNCGSLVMSCNTARHKAAELQYQQYLEEAFQKYLGADPNCAFLSGHSQKTQMLMYNDRWVPASAYAYCRYQEEAEKDAVKHENELKKVVKMVKINLKRDLKEIETVEEDLEECETSSSCPDEESFEAIQIHEKPTEPVDVAGHTVVKKTTKCTTHEVAYEGPRQTGVTKGDHDSDKHNKLGLKEIEKRSLNAEGGDGNVENSDDDESGDGYDKEGPMEFSDYSEPTFTSTSPSFHKAQPSQDDATQSLQMLNYMECMDIPTKLKNDFEIKEFLKRCNAKPVQDFPWLEIREIPDIEGRGVFAKVDIPNDSVVCDYRGLMRTREEVDAMLELMDEVQAQHVKDYLLEFVAIYDGTPKSLVILAHEPVYQGAAVIGRLINHSSKHPNLSYRVLTTGNDTVQTRVIFRSKMEIKAGQQLLWDYGRRYGKHLLRPKCICNKCDRDLEKNSSSFLKPKQDPEVRKTRWEQVSSLSQQAVLKGEVSNVAQVTVEQLLQEVARRAEAVALIEESEGTDAVTAYEKSRAVLNGEEVRPQVLDLPEGSNSLCYLVWAACADAFELGKPVVLILKKNRRDHSPLVVLFGVPVPKRSRDKYGGCVVFEEEEDKTYSMVTQTLANSTTSTVDKEYNRGKFVPIMEQHDELWLELLERPKQKLKELTELLMKLAHKDVVSV